MGWSESILACVTHDVDGTGSVRAVRHRADGLVWAWWTEGNVLGGGSRGDGGRAEPVIVGPGWLTDDEDADRPAFATWTAAGWAALDAWLVGQERGRVLLRPVAGSVLGDAQSVLTFLRRAERDAAAPRAGVVLDPMALLTQSMRARAGDHLTRIADALIEHPGVVALVVASVLEGDSGGGLDPAAAAAMERCVRVASARGLAVIGLDRRGG